MVALGEERDVRTELSTTPAPSWPRTVGAYPDGSTPDAVYMSVWQTPHGDQPDQDLTGPGIG